MRLLRWKFLKAMPILKALMNNWLAQVMMKDGLAWSVTFIIHSFTKHWCVFSISAVYFCSFSCWFFLLPWLPLTDFQWHSFNYPSNTGSLLRHMREFSRGLWGLSSLPTSLTWLISRGSNFFLTPLSSSLWHYIILLSTGKVCLHGGQTSWVGSC